MTRRSPQTVAVVGVGIMGSAIARRVLDQGHRVALFDLDAAKLAALGSLGAVVATSPADAAARSDFVITSLNSGAIVEAAVFGAGGIAEAGDPRRLLIDMSSIDPPATRRIAERLRQQTGMGFVDAPLSGGAPKAATGSLR
jgi:2-hydroxy-3-oxopropionate reductase